MTVGATVVTVSAGAWVCVGEGATVAVGVAVGVGVAVAGLVTTGSLDGTVDGAEVAVETDVGIVDVDDATVELVDAVDEAELVVSVGLVVGSEGDVEVLVDVADVSVDVTEVDVDVDVDVLDVELDDDVVSTTGTGSRVSGDDGRTGCGSPSRWRCSRSRSCTSA